MFKPVASKTDFPGLEREILQFWEEQRIFERSLEMRDGAPEYVFYDGPPFATGLPHYGHLLAGTIKDIVPRYWTMHGFKVERRFGWDCHGLPVENEAVKDLQEKEGLNLAGKYEIEKYGIDKFNEYCRSIVLTYTKEWEAVVKRMGRWVDFENGYRTMDKDFMESLWWVFKQMWDKDLVYQGFRVMPYSWALSTPLSNFEAKMDYKEVQDPAITARFKVDGEENLYLLAWTTTPWTLPSNLALAVGADIEYARVVDPEDGARYILAAERVPAYEKALHREFEVESRCLGKDLIGMSYEPLLPYYADRKEQGAFRVIASGHVSVKEGCGIVHMAPAFGEDDFWVCREEGIDLVDPVDPEGKFTDEVSDFAGQMVKDADKGIIRRLKDDGKLFLHETLSHSYPFCWRTGTPLIYKAIDTWFVKVESFKDKIVKNNKQIRWVPESVGTNRFGNWLEEARDWNISRNRYWGTPLPIWISEDGEDAICFGSVADLEAATGEKITDLHSHFVDKLVFEKNGKTYRRVPEVFDCWFESGSMPFAQNHYPFENKELVERNFPADFIAEGLDQTRGWFYTLNVISTALFDKPAFKNVVVNGLILAEDGEKMSKQKKNYPDPKLIIEKYGADCLRSYMINSPVVRAEPLKFQEAGLNQIVRKVVLPLWNAYSFFVTYANLEGYEPQATLTGSKHDLDRWIISKCQSLVKNVTDHMEGNLLYLVIPELQQFIDLLTNWYIRRSRRRFWRTDDNTETMDAFNTLYYILVSFSKVMAPFQPFLCEAIYRNLTGTEDDSVHLCDYPKSDASLIDQDLEDEMDLIRKTVEMGRSLRMSHDLKVRQPLASMSLVAAHHDTSVFKRLDYIIRDELNVKHVEHLENETHLVEYSARPNLKALGPKLGKALKELNPAIRSLGHAEIQKLLDEGHLEVAGHRLVVEDFLIDRNEKEGMVVLSEEGITIALDTRITEALRVESDARELVNRIANYRKELDFNVEDRVQLWVKGDGLDVCLQAHGPYIQRETLAVALNDASQGPDHEKEWDVNGKSVLIGLRRA